MISFEPPDFSMGDDDGGLLRRFLRRKDNDRIRGENRQDWQQQQQFQMGLHNIRRQQEMERLSKVLNPQAQTQNLNPGMPGLRAAPYNPSLDEYRKGQLELGKDKLELEKEKTDLAREKEQGRSNIANRGMDVKEKLAALKDMPESEKMKLLQDGRISLQEYRDSAAMKRLEVTGQQRLDLAAQQGDIRSGHIDQQNEGAMNRVVKQGEIGSSYIAQRGEEARKTKTTPSSTTTSNSQQKVALQNRAVQFANQNPELASHLTFNEQGFPVISPDAPVKAQMLIYKSIYGTSATTPVGAPGDVNLPATGGVAQPVQQPVQQPMTSQLPKPLPTNKFGVLQKTDTIQPDAEEPQPQSPANNSVIMIKTTPDGKKVTRIVPKDKVQIALSQGFEYQTKPGGQ